MRTHRHSRLVATAVVAAVCAVVGAVPAQADDPTDTTADLIAGVAPDQGQVVPGTTTDDQISVQADNTQVTVPTDPSQPITMNDPAATPPVSVSLPAEATVAKAKVAHDGTVVYHTTKTHGTSVAVQVLTDGATRLQTITPDAHSPHQLTYTFGDGTVPVLNADGTVALVQKASGVTVMLGGIDKAWAADAKGAPVKTSYQVKNGALVQTITPTARTAYPVVADPSITFGWRYYVKYNKAETKTIANAPGSNQAKYAGIVCGAIPNGYFAAACGYDIYDVANSVISTFKSASKAGKCVQMAYAYPIFGAALQLVMGSWKVVTC